MTRLVGSWPWGWTAEMVNALVPDKPRPQKPAPPPPPVQWKLVDTVADGYGISRGKARREIMHGRVLVGGQVELDADRMLDTGAEVEWTSAP